MVGQNEIQSALSAIPVKELTYQEWLNIGAALKDSGMSMDVWESWSANDERYKGAKEIQRKWNSFTGSANPVTEKTIFKMARDRGWHGGSRDSIGKSLDFCDWIEYDGIEDNDEWDPADELITYLKTLFDPDDIVGYVTNDAMQNTDGKWVPCAAGAYDQTAGALIGALERHRDDIGAVIGDWKPDAGAWIRFNPLDGNGVKNENVTKYRYSLVESDDLPISEQEAIIRQLELPVAALVYSGTKSIHAIVHIDAPDLQEYTKRVAYLYDFLDKHSFKTDRQNKNPARLSRMPGVTRGESRQRLLATNIGRKSWDDWMDFAEGEADELPAIVPLEAYWDNPPELPEELIGGILRRGHKMLISGSSKAGKSFLLMELALAISSGRDWLGFPCKKGRVLYVNLEIDEPSAARRFLDICEALGLDKEAASGVSTWPLRGNAMKLDLLVPKLIRKMRGQHFDAVIIDPIYKVITGDENNASDMGAFCNEFDKICKATGCAVIYCHHHRKGSLGNTRAMDRASGSGVFARDPDAQLDMIRLELTAGLKAQLADDGATAWRLESSLREFPNIKPVNFWYRYPIHELDKNGDLSELAAEGSGEANLVKAGKNTTTNERKTMLESAFDCAEKNERGGADIEDIADFCGKNIRSVRRWLESFKDEYDIDNGKVYLKSNVEGGKK